jgi:hypothetical protein
VDDWDNRRRIPNADDLSDLNPVGKMVELRHLRYFVAVAEELHISRAAEKLHVAQPAAGEQIRKLER